MWTSCTSFRCNLLETVLLKVSEVSYLDSFPLVLISFISIFETLLQLKKQVKNFAEMTLSRIVFIFLCIVDYNIQLSYHRAYKVKTQTCKLSIVNYIIFFK